VNLPPKPPPSVWVVSRTSLPHALRLTPEEAGLAAHPDLDRVDRYDLAERASPTSPSWPTGPHDLASGEALAFPCWLRVWRSSLSRESRWSVEGDAEALARFDLHPPCKGARRAGEDADGTLLWAVRVESAADLVALIGREGRCILSPPDRAWPASSEYGVWTLEVYDGYRE